MALFALLACIEFTSTFTLRMTLRTNNNENKRITKFATFEIKLLAIFSVWLRNSTNEVRSPFF